MNLIEMQTLAEEGKLVGLFDGIANEDYHKGPGVSSSGLIAIGETSPAHFIENKKNPKEPTPALTMGNAIHVGILEPELMERYVCFLPETTKGNSNAARTAKAEFLAYNKGKYILPDQEKYDDVRRIRDAVHANPAARNLLKGGKSEQSFFWIDPETGELCKCRSDRLRLDIDLSVNLKSAEDASYKQFQKDIANFKYHWQTAFYEDGMGIVTGRHIQEVHLVVEKSAPYASAIYALDEKSLKKAREDLAPIRHLYAQCRKTNIWPAYSSEVQTITLPSWA